MALKIDVVPKPVSTRGRSATVAYSPEDAQTVVDALASAPDGFVVAFDESAETSSKARQKASAMVSAIVALGHPKLSTRVITHVEAVYEKDGKTLKTPGEYQAAIINKPARQKKTAEVTEQVAV